ncbi:hypothetical protein SprV_0100132800 [Sparganum proliferum]
MILCHSIARKPALLGALIKLYIVESIVDPDVKSVSHFSLTEVHDAFLLDLDISRSKKSEKTTSWGMRLTLAYSSSSPLKSGQRAFAQMRASHLGFTGVDALKKVNVSIILPVETTSCTGPTCLNVVFESCLVLTAPYDLFPYPRARSSCDTSSIARVKAGGTNKLLWQKRSNRVMYSYSRKSLRQIHTNHYPSKIAKTRTKTCSPTQSNFFRYVFCVSLTVHEIRPCVLLSFHCELWLTSFDQLLICQLFALSLA